MRRVVSSLLCLLLAAAAIWFLWQRGSFSANRHGAPTASIISPKAAAATASSSAGKSAGLAMAGTNRPSLRLTNTTKSIGELVGDSHAILLQNAFLDTSKPLNLAIPDNLKLKGNPGAYIVQARGPINNAFRAVIAGAGGQIVSYIPNDAYLVELTPSEAGFLGDNTLVQAVLPYEPYYKLQPSLLSLAVADKPLTPGTALNLVLFPADAVAAENGLIALGARPIGPLEQSPFGPVLRVLAPANWTELMQVQGIQIAERVPSRVLLNDLSRVTVGESTDTVTPTNYLNLSGANVMVAVADTGIDTNHPDFGIGGGAGHADTVPPTRVWGYRPGDFIDTAGHGTFVAGEIAGNGSESYMITNIPEGSVTNADFRGKAPAADLFSINFDNSDQVLQQEAALTNALISNNSWGYGGDQEYDIAAASYDSATRDALPFSSGSQPVLFVFAAGDSGEGDDSGGEGGSDTILSPGTAKNVVTVGALEQLRNITNIVTTVTGTGTNTVTNQTAYWQPKTDSSDQVAGYSSRGNVGVNTEGVYGRFKPDVVAPGTFVVSTSSGIPPDYQWNTNAYYNPTNVSTTTYAGQTVGTNSLIYYNVTVPPNAVAVTINITSNALSIPFPSNIPIYVQQSQYPTTTTYDFVTTNDNVSIPPDGPVNYLSQILNSGFYFAVGNNTNVSANSVNYDVTVSIYTTNDVGDLDSVLQGMNNAIGPWYRYESGTSMSAAEVSGVLALIDDYFTNTLQMIPSPALLKAMLINGSRSVGSYNYGLTNGVNFQGWGLVNIANSLPLATNSPTSPMTVGVNSALNQALFVVDQNVTNALATGDSHTYFLTVNTNVGSIASFLNLQATLVWTDPAGNPSAAIKLVNNLDLIITNLDTGEVYFGNDISPSLGFNLPWTTNTTTAPNLDSINNVENIFLNPISSGEELGTNYSITVVGRQVNVNSLTAQTNNVLQDYALVVSIGEGEQPDAISSVTDVPTQRATTTDQDITFVATTNAPLFDQFAGENWPLASTNTLPLGSNTVWGANAQLTIGQINQWHFYVVTNNGLDAQGSPVDVTNAAFITFDPNTLSIPRMGVNEEANPGNATRPEADIDLYVTTDSGLTNLNPATIANCLAGVGESGVSLGQGGTEFVYFTNSAAGEVYYVGVKSEDREASEYAFIPIFTATPFSQLNQNGDEIVNGLLLPMPIPDGNNAKPGSTNIFALAINNIEVGNVIVTNWNQHQNFGDLLGVLSFDDTSCVLNNHDGLGNTFDANPLVYDDSSNPILGSRRTDVPGDLQNYRGKSAIGPWILTEVDDAIGSTGQVSRLNLVIQPHRNLLGPGIIVTVPPLGWFIDYVDVAPGYTNLTFDATNLPPTIAPLPLQMYEQLNAEPTLNTYDQREDLTNCVPGTGLYPVGIDPGNDISVGPPLNDGRYFIGLYNPSSSQSATVFLSASLGLGTGASDVYTYSSSAPTTLMPDAVTDDSVFVAATQQVASVNVGIVVKSPQIADYTFTLVSPTGQRVLLMENRGGGTTNGAGDEFVYTNILSTTATGGGGANTNYLTVSPSGEMVPVYYDFFTVPDEMTVFAGTNPATFTPANTSNPLFLFDSGLTNNPNGPASFNISVPPGYTNITIIMNEFGNPFAAKGDAWNYTAGAPATNFQYLEFTDDTNLANVPIKFAVPPYNFTDGSSNFTLSDFELATNGDYHGVTNIYDLFGGWTVPTNLLTMGTIVTNDQTLTVTNQVPLPNNEVSVVTDPFDSLGDNAGTNFLALAKGTITRLIPTIPGRDYNLTFWYRGPGIAGWWRAEGNATDSSDPENNGNNGRIVGQINYVAGFVGQAFQFPDLGNEFDFGGTNGYVQIPQNPSLDVGKGGGLTVEGWIQPTNIARPQPLVEWLAGVPTNSTGTNVNPAVTNLTIIAGPYLDRANGNYYYLLNATNWTTSEIWAEALGGHLATVNNANEQNWIFDNFGNFDGISRNLWIGLTNTYGITFGWISGQTNVPYTNWFAYPNQPQNCGPEDYTFIYGNTNVSAGLWTAADNNGAICGLASVSNSVVYGVAEVTNLQTNGVQFWISVTNTPGTTNAPFANTNGCLYANIVDTNFVSHEVISAPGLIVETNYYHHVALTFDNSNGIAKLFLDGTNVVTTNLFLVGGNFVPFVPKTDGDVLLGHDMTRATNNFYTGGMDEMSVYRRALSDSEITAIYLASVLTNNFNIGKFDPSVTPSAGLAEAQVVFNDNTTNILFGVNNQWQEFSYTFTATTNSLPLQITGLEPGVLLDQFAVAEAPLTNLYYLPEQSLSALTGTSANGNWTLQVWDNITQTLVNPSQLVDWSLTFVLNSNATVAATMQPETPATITVGPGQVVDLSVPVPAWAQFASNLVVSTSPQGSPVDLLFNPTNPPTGEANDTVLINNQSAPPVARGGPDLFVNQSLPFSAANQAGSSYYLGVRNNGSHAVQVTVEVDFDITALTNGLPLTSYLTNTDTVRYFSFNVTSNAYEATFQLLQMNSNADLVVSKGAPLPTLTSSDYGSFSASNSDENIYVLTNSTPVPLSAGTWYLGVVKRDSVVDYTVLAKELDATNGMTNLTIINLTNGVPFNWTAGPGAALTNFFSFVVTNTVNSTVTNLIRGVRFELYNLTGNGDLIVQTNALPLSPPFFETSQNPGQIPEQMLIFTNRELTNMAANWYLGVPNNEITNINYTILAVIETNSYFPAFPGASGSGGGALGGGRVGMPGDVYHVTTNSDSGPGSLRDAIDTATTNRTVVFDISGVVNLLSPLVITNSYLDIAGQTAPGIGITVAGQMTTVTNAHDVIIRDIRFRRGSIDDSLQLSGVSNVVADHVSAEWSDRLLSVLNSTNVTVQWSIMADSLYLTNSAVTNPATGSFLRYGSGGISLNHNLYADNYSGSPRLGDNLSLDFVNNVIYNWGLYPGLAGGTNDLDYSTTGSTNELNYVCNYLIAGPDTATFGTNYSITNIAFFGGVTNGSAANWIFQSNNIIDSNTNGILDGANTQWAMFTNDYTKFEVPFPLVTVPTDEAFLAYEKVLDFAGPDMDKRDPADTNIVVNVRNQTGRLISHSPLAGLVGWWKGESNTVDSVFGNNGTWINSAGAYATGEVGAAFDFDGINQYMLVQTTNSDLDVGKGTGFTFEAWVKPTALTVMIICEYENILGSHNGADDGVQFGTGSGTGVGDLVCNIKDIFNVDHVYFSNPGLLAAGVWQHVALTYDKASGTATFYRNGISVGSMNMGNFTPQTSFTNFLTAKTIYNSVANPIASFNGGLDELSIYKRALSPNEIASIYQAGSAGKFANPPAVQPYLDTDQDGIPDFWEWTFTPTNVFIPSNNNDRNGSGYTDLEEYNNWLAGLHALTVTNTPVGVDLLQLFGKTGNLSFSVTNGVHGSVYLTNVLGTVTNTGLFSNSIAVFTPTNNLGAATNYYGYASFDVYVTNNDTIAYFGPATVSVVVSALPIATNLNFPPVITPLVSGTPVANASPVGPFANAQSNTRTNTGGSDYYQFPVGPNTFGENPVEALFAVTNASGPVELVVSYGLPLPSLSSYDYISDNPFPANQSIVVVSNSTPVGLTNGNWYLSVVNVSGSNVTYDVVATELYSVVPPIFTYPTNGDVFTNIETTLFTLPCQAVDSNTPPLPLTYGLTKADPTNMIINSSSGVISWTPTEAQGPSTNTIYVSVSNGDYGVTNSFTVVVEESNLPPVLPVIPDQVVDVPGTLTVANTATDPDIPINTLTYQLLAPPAGATIDPNSGIIMWTPTAAQAGSSYVITTIVTDYNPWAVNSQHLSATNSFSVVVASSVPVGTPQTNTVPSGVTSWFAVHVPKNAVFATNILLYATNLPVNVWYSTNVPPTTTNANDYDLMPNATSGVSVLTPTSTPTNIVPGGTYYLGVQNPNAVAVGYSVEVDFLLSVPISSIIHTNIGGTNGYLLTWFGHSNYLFEVKWAGNLASAHWNSFTNVISYNPAYPAIATNAQFNFFDDGSQTGGLGPWRFYQLELFLQPPGALALPVQTSYVASVGVPLVVTNTATETNVNYVLRTAPTPSMIPTETNGIIWWTPAAADAGGEFKFTTVVTDNGVPPLSATNAFTVFVLPYPSITNVLATATNVTLSWGARASDLFEVEWATNLAPGAVWSHFAANVTSTTGAFRFTDPTVPTARKFYRLSWQPLP
jgi:subtilisin-like proprotein convertase family protein